MLNKLDNKREVALSFLQDTQLSPMEEALFHHWAKANQIDKPDAPDDPTDYRGIYKSLGGKVLPYGQLKQTAKTEQNKQQINQFIRDQFAAKQESSDDMVNQLHKEERQDVTHQQKMEQGKLQLQKAPFDLQSQELKNQGKVIDVQAKQAQAEQQKYKSDETLTNALLQREMGTMGGGMQPSAPTSTEGAES